MPCGAAPRLFCNLPLSINPILANSLCVKNFLSYLEFLITLKICIQILMSKLLINIKCLYFIYKECICIAIYCLSFIVR